jgi:26S proteasome regulatory subunit N7
MAPYLSHLLSSNLIPSTSETSSLLSTLESKNTQHLKELQDKLKDSKDNLGETEVSDALREKASYLAKIGEKVTWISVERPHDLVPVRVVADG